MTSVSALRPLVAELAPEFHALSDAIWDHPQLRWEEHDAAARHLAIVEREGFAVTRDIGGIPTAFQAEKGTEGPVVAFLGEYDALAGLSQQSGSAVPGPDPGNITGHGHGCGHHMLGAGSLLAAVSLARHLEQRDLPGRVRYYGCPAEEAAAGKSFMAAAGAFDDVDAALTWHPAGGTGTISTQGRCLAYVQAHFRFTGVAAHAGVSPHLGRSALDAAELMNVGVNFLREHMADSSRIHYAFTDAGGESPNVVPATSEVYYLVRAETVPAMQELYDRVVAIARGAAQMTSTEVEVRLDGASAEILPNRVLEEALHGTLIEVGGVPFDEADQERAAAFSAGFEAGEVRRARVAAGMAAGDARCLHDGVPELAAPEHRHLNAGSSDVGDVSWITPTVQILSSAVALGTPWHTWQYVAQGKLPAAHKAITHAATVIAATALDLLADPALLAAARAEHAATLKETPYVCPIPDGMLAPPARVSPPSALRR
ncbi:amidohydrolase [Amycolatopsis acidicola]|uniref:Amidohydrolase n=1 Tax=Amycolatopsis acidicola TaxID=2596893 RepID=A0A5N0UZP9_9PSEU|nr:amidohydrolase [Amycolatopsis acidicola]KAA9157329.1 amidohydrolase [Amycolatopsis acidicola]